MILREIMQTLERIEHNQRDILSRMGAAEDKRGEPAAEAGDKWLQDGIDSIMSYQAGKKEDSR